MTTKLTTRIILIGILFFCVHIFPQLASAQDKSSPAKLARLLEESGNSYTKVADNIWTIAFKGKTLPEFNVVASTEQGLLFLIAIVAEKKTLKVTPPMLQKLLALNADFDRVKIGIDKEGDVFARTDLSVRTVDAQELKENIEQLAAATDETFAAIKPFITIVKK
ncbi:MAG: YbjN domain-containing protein [Pyrinomonadaceae bacterium]